MHAPRTAMTYLRPALLCAASIVPACAGARAGGPACEEGVARQVTYFTRIEASGPIDLSVELGGSLAVTVGAGGELATRGGAGALRRGLSGGGRNGGAFSGTRSLRRCRRCRRSTLRGIPWSSSVAHPAWRRPRTT